MDLQSVGIITNSRTAQGSINDDHATDIANAVTALGLTARRYNLTDSNSINQIIADHREGRLNIVFNNAAGKLGGDGTVEGLLEMNGIPYVGSDVLATAVAFDKKTTKSAVGAAGVPIIRGMNFTREQYETKRDWVLDEIEYGLKFPVVVKASQGSDSIGISLVRSRPELPAAIDKALEEDDVIIVEDFVKRLAEVTCMVLGTGEQTRALAPIERVFEGDILYSKDITERTYRVADHLDLSVIRPIEHYAIEAHKALGCTDYSRSDFIVTARGEVFFLELNAHAGLGTVGPTVAAAEATFGWNHQQLIGKILELAAARYSSLAE